MNEIEKIRRYIERHATPHNPRYNMSLIEGLELSKAAYEAKGLPLGIIILAYNYGMAKGYRAAKAEAKLS